MEKTFKLITADKNKIPIIHAKRGGDRLIVASHGISSEKTEENLYRRFIEKLPPNYDVLLFDFRGHGDSKLRPIEVTIAGEVLDLMTVFNWARAQNYSSIDHIATSFGASIALLAVDGYRLRFLRKTVFWNPVINYRNTFTESTVEWGQSYFDQKRIEELSIRSFTQIAESKFRISALMTQELLLLHPERVMWPSSTPLLILHGDSDTLVPVSDAQSYARANKARIKIFKGIDHGFEDAEEEAISTTISWLKDEKVD